VGWLNIKSAELSKRYSMMRSKRVVGIAIIVLAVLAGAASAHKAPVDKNGCHYDWQGKRHCH
jgi:hypothetical protein